MPAQRARVGVDREQRTGIEVVAFAIVAVVVGIWIAGAVIEQVELRVITSGDPRRSAAACGYIGIRPRLAAQLAGIRNRIEAPDAPARLRVVRVDVAAAGEVAAGDADDHFVLHDQRRRRDRVRFLQIADGHVPEDRAGLAFERDQMRVERAHVEAIAEQRESAIHRAAAHRRREIRRQRARVLPDRPAGPRVERERLVVVARDVRHAVDDERRVFEAASGKAGDVGLEQPVRCELRHVGRRNLRQRAVTLSRVIAGERRPVGVLLR